MTYMTTQLKLLQWQLSPLSVHRTPMKLYLPSLIPNRKSLQSGTTVEAEVVEEVGVVEAAVKEAEPKGRQTPVPDSLGPDSQVNQANLKAGATGVPSTQTFPRVNGEAVLYITAGVDRHISVQSLPRALGEIFSLPSNLKINNEPGTSSAKNSMTKLM